MPAPTQSDSTPRLICLEIQGFVIPNFKNSKRWLTKLPNGKPLERPILVTDHKVQKVMQEIVRAFESQLLSAIQTGTDEIHMEHLRQSLIASLAPSDDCWEQMPKIIIEARLCRDGEKPGATITIERLT